MNLTSVCLGLISGIFAGGIIFPANAQVTSDGTTHTTVNQSGNNFHIINGIKKGNNLFHSFNDFSIPTGGSATFDLINTPNIKTIFSRVTGGNVSNIDGLIQTLNGNHPASLFLINPNGIIFGQNARLDIGGSFVGTTANSIKFADGIEFSAINPSASALLTMSVPIGLQLGQSPADIQVNQNGHTLSQPVPRIFPFPTTRDRNNLGLTVNPGYTMALIGGNIFLNGGILTAESGRIELGSVSQGNIGINPDTQGFAFDYGQTNHFGNIQLSQRALLDVSGAPSGSIQLQGDNIFLRDGSTIFAQNQGVTAGGILQISAQDMIEISGFSTTIPSTSLIQSETLGLGKGNDVIVSAKHLSIQTGGQILNFSYSSAPTGKTTINTSESLILSGFAPPFPTQASAIVSQNFSSGFINPISIFTGQLEILEGGTLSSVVLGSGKGGDVNVIAKSIGITGINPLAQLPSTLATTTFTSGNGGHLRIDAGTILVRDAGLTANTLAAGNAGNMVLHASESITITGEDSRIASSAVRLSPLFQALFGLPELPTGNSGSAEITTPRLSISDEGVIGVRNEGPGDAGNLLLRANRINLETGGMISAATNSGEGGNIAIASDIILMRSGSSVTATAGGIGNGGNLSIDAPIIVGLENSDIIANAVNGNGGNINITTQGIFGLEYRSQLTPKNDITASSQFGVSGTVDINNIGVDPNSGLIELPTNLVDSSQQIAAGCAETSGSSFVATGRGGIPQNPNQQVWSDRTWSDVRDISAFQHKNSPVTAKISETPAPLVQATSWRRNAQGKIELVADKSIAPTPQLLTCAAVTKS
ncbi:S-layer family protein [Nodularia harveyana UHCC-0300]|uniref:S-layer family protein n=1 Tax=Nodularia harveyana UHCC-0300 TaxID=2974287 RepID=A0ABU5U938_9CYAN|nr:S-layer family protein [Nodularia harveyana]MEA5580042.1 S-layer family protein [Nodularia harveyana UHCC-0300]